MEKICPRCGALFACRHESVEDCHCVGVPLDEAQRAFIADNYDDCLCNDCLLAVKEGFYACEVNPLFCFVKLNIGTWLEK
jgi:hypothetical protein